MSSGGHTCAHVPVQVDVVPVSASNRYSARPVPSTSAVPGASAAEPICGAAGADVAAGGLVAARRTPRRSACRGRPVRCRAPRRRRPARRRRARRRGCGCVSWVPPVRMPRAVGWWAAEGPGPPTAPSTRRTGSGVQTARSLNAGVTTTRISRHDDGSSPSPTPPPTPAPRCASSTATTPPPCCGTRSGSPTTARPPRTPSRRPSCAPGGTCPGCWPTAGRCGPGCGGCSGTS